MTDRIYDVAIIGGGIMGSSVAYHLMRADDRLKVIVIEKDLTYEKASTPLSMGNLRVQFDIAENIMIALHGFDEFKHFEQVMAVKDDKPNIAYRREGNLFLIKDEDIEEKKRSFDLQKSLGGKVKWLSRKEIKKHFPLYNPQENIIAGTFGLEDGHLDPYSVLMSYKAKAKQMGAKIINDEVVKILVTRAVVEGVALRSREIVKARSVVNCAGPWAAHIAQTAGASLPIIPIKRQCFAVNTVVTPDKPMPMTFLPSGLFFRSETGNQIIMGKSMDEDPVGFDFSWQTERFMEILWPEIAKFVPAFEKAKLMRGWAGLYAVNTLDNNAILGEWPEIRNLFLANGFSGHGIMQAPAVGLYLAELILSKTPSLDLKIFSPLRVLEKKSIQEGAIL